MGAQQHTVLGLQRERLSPPTMTRHQSRLCCSPPRVLAHAWVHLAVQAWVLARVLAASIGVVAVPSTLLVLLVLLVPLVIVISTTRHVALDGVQQELQTRKTAKRH